MFSNRSLKKFCISQGMHLFGVADVSQAKKEFLIRAEALIGIDRAVSLGVRLQPGVLEEIDNQPTSLYYHHYRMANMLLDQAAVRIASHIQQKGFRAIPIAASQIIDWNKQRAHLSHKHVGILAGMGWVGRNNLLVNKDAGSQFRLATILTDMPLRPDKPALDDCGECRECIKSCPAGAIRPYAEDFGHMECYAMLKEFQRKKIVEQFICGVCVKACAGKKKRRTK